MSGLSNLSSAMPALKPFAVNAPASNTRQVLGEKAVELEGVFLNTLMSQMFSSLDARSDFGGGYAEETWRSMQAEQYASLIAENGGIGLADDILSDLLAIQESSLNQQTSASKGSKGVYPS